MNALVVDDSRAMRRILGRMLREIGYEVSEAAHGREALQRLREMRGADVALVDWNMPEMDGYEFLRAVRSQPTYDGMRVMMVTTECGLDKVRTALDAGADDYIMKPFTMDVIREKLALLAVASR